MFWKTKHKAEEDDLIPVPVDLPPIEGLEEEAEPSAGSGQRTWLWTLLAALAVVLLLAFVLVMGGFGIYDGLKDRALDSLQSAQDHYNLGLGYLEAENYELAIAEFEYALRHDSSLHDAQIRLQEAKELAKAQATPTSETRQDAARLLYTQAVAHFEGGSLVEAAAVLEELRGLDADYQKDNVETMLVMAHSQLGLIAVEEDRLDQAIEHFEEVLVFKPNDANAQEQLNLAHVYTAALNYWDRDWPATIQGLRGLYALAPDYKDVQMRLHDAYVYNGQDYAEEGNWCQASQEYAAAVSVLPMETTVDKRDDAAIWCQATAEAPTATPATRATATATAPPQSTPAPGDASSATPTAVIEAPGKGRIAFAGYDAIRQVHDIYVVSLAQGDARLLRESASQPDFAPAGNRLTFRNVNPEYLGLGVMDLHTDLLSEVTAHEEDSSPRWSPDSLQLIFASNKHGDRKWRIYAISPGEVRGEGEEWAFGQMPTWSPDGSRVAYHGCDERGDNCGIWVMKSGGFEPSLLTTDSSDTAPAWSPDGTQIAFISARSGNWELYLTQAATGEQTRLTDQPSADVAPTWSPDGRQLAFLSNRGGAWALHLLDLKSGQVQKVIATGDAYPDPVSERISWAP
jgi:TolB protein